MIRLKSDSFSTDSLQDLKLVTENIYQFASQFITTTRSQNKVLACVHSLNFPKSISESEILRINHALGQAYHDCSCPVLGGDTSSGKTLVATITLICLK
jgi:hypothetical protein